MILTTGQRYQLSEPLKDVITGRQTPNSWKMVKALHNQNQILSCCFDDRQRPLSFFLFTKVSIMTIIGELVDRQDVTFLSIEAIVVTTSSRPLDVRRLYILALNVLFRETVSPWHQTTRKSRLGLILSLRWIVVPTVTFACQCSWSRCHPSIRTFTWTKLLKINIGKMPVPNIAHGVAAGKADAGSNKVAESEHCHGCQGPFFLCGIARFIGVWIGNILFRYLRHNISIYTLYILFIDRTLLSKISNYRRFVIDRLIMHGVSALWKYRCHQVNSLQADLNHIAGLLTFIHCMWIW